MPMIPPDLISLSSAIKHSNKTSHSYGIDLDSKIFLGQSVAQSFAWTCSALSIMHVLNFKVLAQILKKL